MASASGSCGRLSSEAVVYLIRTLRGPGQEAVLGGLVERLSHRISRIVMDSAKGFDPTTTEEIVNQVNLDVGTLILEEAPTRQGESLEYAFNLVVKRRALNEVERREHHPRAAQIASPTVGPDGGVLDPVETLADEGPGPEEIAIERESPAWAKERIRVGLDAIKDPRHREAVILHYLQGWPITDRDPSTPTLSSHFRVSGRQIHNWFKAAFAEMRQAMGDTYEP